MRTYPRKVMPDAWPPKDGEVVHMRLTYCHAGNVVGGQVVDLALLCEQFGPAVPNVSFVAVGPQDRALVTCEDCISAMHA